ncbi:MAG TPA: GNAT family N-acetyltransferase [Acetobacteraceae bacterium]|nr:GNAT family N-acetyltransferase [Acetobacteraceae bacterium]
MPPDLISPLDPVPASAISAPPCIVTLAERPDLLPLIAQWLRDHHAPHEPLARYAAQLARRTSPLGSERCFVLLAGGVPAGTASLTSRGLESRPELTPWLTNVFVAPSFRGHGFARRLVVAVETAAHRAAIPVLWLYTRSSEPLYDSLGWHRAGAETHDGAPVTLMRRDFGA